MESFSLVSADGTPLAAGCWSPNGQPVAEVVLVHGACEHLGRYAHVAAALTQAGFRVTGVDLRGHGRSGGQRGFVERFGDYVSDLRAVAAAVGEPYYLVGHSMGGLVCLDHLRTAPQVLGVALSAPLLGVAVQPPWIKRALGQVLSRLAPRFAMHNELDPSALCSDPAVVAAYQSDPLVYDQLTPRWYTEMLGALDRVWGHQAQYTQPLYCAWGEDDRIVNVQAIARFMDGYQAPHQVVSYPGLCHEIMNEPSQAQVLRQLTSWLTDQLGAPGSQGDPP